MRKGRSLPVSPRSSLYIIIVKERHKALKDPLRQKEEYTKKSLFFEGILIS